MNALLQRAEALRAQGIWLGGPAKSFETAGRKLLMTLLNEGLLPGSKVLDVGCGSLRGGYWLIHFLDRGCYFGIEPNRAMLDGGRRILLEEGLEDLKAPRFDPNHRFDFGVFGETFDFVVARSIWSHASKEQIKAMLDSFAATSRPGSILLASYLRRTLRHRDYRGAGWIGRSHQSAEPGVVHHSLRWIRHQCARRGLLAREVRDRTCNFGKQRWLRIQSAAV